MTIVSKYGTLFGARLVKSYIVTLRDRERVVMDVARSSVARSIKVLKSFASDRKMKDVMKLLKSDREISFFLKSVMFLKIALIAN